MAEGTASEARKAGIWVTVWGVLLIVAGAVAILVPAPAALAFVLLLAWLLVFAGVVEVVYAFHQRGEEGFGWKLASALATLVLGVLLLLFPGAGIATLALMIGGFLLATGASNVMLAFRLKPKAGWAWVLLDGVLAIVVAILIASRWPQDSIGFVGILVGISLISGGMWRIVLGRALRSGTVPLPAKPD